MALKENYKDDILDVSVNTKRKYQMENNGDGTVSFTDVTEYTQQGDSFGASDMNATNGKVNDLESDIGEINDNLTASNDTPFRFEIQGGVYGYLKADDSFAPFRSMLSKACIVSSGWTGAAQDALLFADDGSVTSMHLGRASLEDNNLKVEMFQDSSGYFSRVYAKALGTKVKVIKYTEADSNLTINDVTTTSVNQLVLELNGRSSAPYNFGIGFVQLY